MTYIFNRQQQFNKAICYKTKKACQIWFNNLHPRITLIAHVMSISKNTYEKGTLTQQLNRNAQSKEYLSYDNRNYELPY